MTPEEKCGSLMSRFYALVPDSIHVGTHGAALALALDEIERLRRELNGTESALEAK